MVKYSIDIQIVRPEMTKFKMFREKVNMDFYLKMCTFIKDKKCENSGIAPLVLIIKP
jgi:predicted RNA-binding protein